MKRILVAIICLGCAVAITATAGPKSKKTESNEQKGLKKELLDKYDLNKDGKLDKDEKAKMSKEDRKKMAQARKKGENKEKEEKQTK